MPAGIGLAGAGSVAVDLPSLKVMIVTDAWAPQVNGVVRTLEVLGQELTKLGHDVRYVTPQGRFTIPMPTYAEIRLALFARRTLENEIREFAPDAIHIATEGTLGTGARAICLRYSIPFTTSFHTRFPEYVHARFPVISEETVYRFLLWFHGPAQAMMVATAALRDELAAKGFKNMRLWSRGVNTDQFCPKPDRKLDYPGPVWLYVGRIAVEKNIEAFLKLDLPGTKVLVGDGPAKAHLEKAYPEAKFLGPRSGEPLVDAYAGSDVFVFPSKTDTFGLVMLEALACGTPVAAYPVRGPQDVLTDGAAGVMDEDLGEACRKALTLSRQGARDFALNHSWHACTAQFLSNLAVDQEG